MTSNKTNKLSDNFIKMVVQSLPEKVVTFLKETKCVLAGGYVRDKAAGRKPKDIDIFIYTKTIWNFPDVKKHRSGGLYDVANGIVDGEQLQIIEGHFGNTEEVIGSFDFTVCRAGIFYEDEKWKSVCHEDFLVDVSNQRLVYTVPVQGYDLGEQRPIRRALRFCSDYGYTISQSELLKLVPVTSDEFYYDVPPMEKGVSAK